MLRRYFFVVELLCCLNGIFFFLELDKAESSTLVILVDGDLGAHNLSKGLKHLVNSLVSPVSREVLDEQAGIWIDSLGQVLLIW